MNCQNKKCISYNKDCSCNCQDKVDTEVMQCPLYLDQEELKMGDKVEVFYGGGGFIKRIFVKYGKNDGVICVSEDSEEQFLKGEYFLTNYFSEWRIPEEKKYRPFTWEDRELFREKWVKVKHGVIERLILEFDETKIKAGVDLNDYKSLFDYYTFLDGSSCGVEVKE